jgi:cytochrome c biogenesis protein ResB
LEFGLHHLSRRFQRAKDLIVRDKSGEIYTVRYDAVNTMLLNKFLKEHRKVEEQGAMIAKQQKQIEALASRRWEAVCRS